MPIQRLLQNLELEAEAFTRLVRAYEKTLHALRLVDRTDPITELVARKVIEIGRSGGRDAAEISSLALRQLGAHEAVDATKPCEQCHAVAAVAGRHVP
jgi:hypothetical protein